MIVILDEAPSDPVDPVYRFRGADGQVAWPMRDGLGLGAAGAWNFFWRLGFVPKLVADGETAVPVAKAVLVVTAERPLAPPRLQVLRQWHQAGNWIIAAGDPAAFGDHLPPGAQREHSPYPTAALGYLDGAKVEVIAPPGWPFARWPATVDAISRGGLGAIMGERQTPARATIERLDGAPAFLLADRFLYLNANPFAAFQAWLQGQENLAPWLEWRPRLFWLDEHVASLWRLMVAAVPDLAVLPRPGVPGLRATTVVLRHDVDDSRDTTYLDLVERRSLKASYAVLLDRNRGFWVDRLARSPNIESAYHYNTIDRRMEIVRELRRRGAALIGRTQPRAAGYRPALSEIARTGLAHQTERARAHGIGIATLHRHGPFLVYPEWIDALDHCLRVLPELLGSSSLFRGTVLRWGAREADGNFATLFDFPDSGFPLWWPFKLAHAARGGTLLRGWETTSVMECEPALVAQLLDHELPELPQRLITVSYHPAHARRASYRPGGSAPWFDEVLDLIAERGIETMTLSEVYEKSRAGVTERPKSGGRFSDASLIAPLRNFFDERAAAANPFHRNGYGSENDDHEAYMDALFADLDRHLDTAIGQSALDVGCGAGDLLARLQRRTGNARGLDIAPAMVAAARARGLQALVSDGGRFPFEDGSFDRVLMNFVLINTPFPSMARRLAEECLRVLAPGGRLVIGTNPKPGQSGLPSAARLVALRRLRQALRRGDKHLWLVSYDYRFFLDFYERHDLAQIALVNSTLPYPGWGAKFHVLLRKRAAA